MSCRGLEEIPERMPMSPPPGVVVSKHVAATVAELQGCRHSCLQVAVPCPPQGPSRLGQSALTESLAGHSELWVAPPALSPGLTFQAFGFGGDALLTGMPPCRLPQSTQSSSLLTPGILSGRLKTVPSHGVKSVLGICPRLGLGKDHSWSPEPLSQFGV